MAGTAGGAFLHLAHTEVFNICFVWKQFRMAVGAFVHAKVELMAECCISGICLKSNIGWFKVSVALLAITAGGKGIVAIVTGPA